jgi:two-component system, chemotaxis family, response regulator PixH
MARVLLATSDTDEMERIRAALEADGHQLSTMTDGAEAERRIIEERPEVAVLDVVLPGRSGFQLCRTVRGHARVQHVPIVLLSSLDRDSDRYWALRQGATEFVPKPLDVDAVREKVRACLEGPRVDLPGLP